ncbi:MAG: transketolase [Dehalococcoidia bacterium]|nr:transketolase [Dehalococcoidia bacterium]
MSKIDQICINTIRCLAIDAVQKANSGHPGAPMGMASMAYVLWDRFLKHNPADPGWVNRDRFILSAGHASAMLYALLHLTGYGLSLEEIKNFRQWESRTPGHPEHGLTPGVEATTGPLGQGFANGVGMAMAEKIMAQHYNQPGDEIIDHYTYAIVSDGDLMEGVASEAASLAGTLRLGKLIYLYDDNDISIEGHTDLAFREDVGKRFEAYGWHVSGPIDGVNVDAIDAAIRQAQMEKDRPSLIICKTIIGYGSPNKANTAACHGEPLGEKEILLTKKNLGCPFEEPFAILPEALAHFRQSLERGQKWQRDWDGRMEAYSRKYPEAAGHLKQDLSGDLPAGWDQGLGDLFASSQKPVSTRAASGLVINSVAPKVHTLTGGSADLAPSNKTFMKGRGDFGPENYLGHNLHFGVREHAMGAIANGMALHGGIIPYTATFLVFYDYMRPSVRLAALMGLRVIFLFTHDSIGVGEDGPTHQPIEQLVGLRSVPNLVTLRPADAAETAESWRVALEREHAPTALILSRQDLPVLDRSKVAPASGLQQGGYVLWESSASPQVILIGTGSEVHIALEAGQVLKGKGIPVRVVSLPSWELFEAQPQDYRDRVLPPGIRARISIEAGTPLGWERYTGLDGVAIGISRFGASAPAAVIYEKLGLTPKVVVDKALSLLGKS